MSRAMIAAIAGLTAAGVATAFAVDGYAHFVLTLVALTTLAGTGLNILAGLSGLISFGHAGFYAIGAYGCAILSLRGVPLWMAAPAAALVAAAVGVLLAIPAMRVRGPYLAMVTIAFGFIVEHGAIEWAALTGGQNGLIVPPAEGLGEQGLAIAAVLLAGLGLAAFAWLGHSRLGRAMVAVRDNDHAARSLGLDPMAVRITAFALSALLTGLAGALLPPLMMFIAPSSFPFSQSILFVLAVMVGGAGTVLGPVIGAVVTVMLPEMLAGLAEYRLLFFGLFLLVVLWLVPSGVVGTVARWLRRHQAEGAVPGDAAGLIAVADRADLEVRDLGIAFGGIRAADGVALTARAGAVTAIIGPNGAGKTTVLNMIGGFYRPDRGSVRLGAVELAGRPAHRVARAGIARTYQTTRLFETMTVAANVAAAMGRRDDRRAVSALLDFVGYAGPLDAVAGDLPHVDRRLVEIARALGGNPRVLLLDEPAAGLMRADKDRLAGLFRRIADAGVAVVLVEHDMTLVMGASDHIVVLDAGRLLAAGPPAAIRQDPAVIRAYLGGAGAAGRPRPVPWDGPADAVLSVLRLTAGYGAAPVLDQLSLDVRPGETVALLGANGAGKSTAMRALSGLLRPVEGAIILNDEAVERLDSHQIARRGLALVPEGRQVFPELSVIDNIRLGGHARQDRVDPAEIEALLDRFPRLRERAGQRAGLLSGGEQQMLAIARGLMARPRLLMLDEPSLGLAPAIINDLYAVLAELRDAGITILLVDQMAALALTIADRGYVLEQGRVVASGDADVLAADAALEAAYLGGVEQA